MDCHEFEASLVYLSEFEASLHCVARPFWGGRGEGREGKEMRGKESREGGEEWRGEENAKEAYGYQRLG